MNTFIPFLDNTTICASLLAYYYLIKYIVDTLYLIIVENFGVVQVIIMAICNLANWLKLPTHQLNLMHECLWQ